jgi:hypothetical protein
VNILNIDFLVKNARVIHSFGLGFIQIKISPTERVHFYCPAVTLTTAPEDLHDHRYNFTSTILKGTLTNEIYVADLTGSGFRISDETCSPDVKAQVQLELDCSVKLLSSSTMASDSHYFIDKDVFHRVTTNRAVTYLKRDLPSKDFARVIRSKDSDPVCPFSANLPVDTLWEIVREEIACAY